MSGFADGRASGSLSTSVDEIVQTDTILRFHKAEKQRIVEETLVEGARGAYRSGRSRRRRRLRRAASP